MTSAQPPDCLLMPRSWIMLTLGLVALVAVIYVRALTGAFVWDDDAHVTAPALRSLPGLWRIWTDIWATQQYYPLLHTAFWVEHALWGDAVLGYHLVNVAQHGITAALFGLVLRELRVPGALFAAVLFAVHPVHVESVAWISEQKNTLSTALYLAAALFYLRFDRERRWVLYAAASGLFICGLLTKTVTATLPAALLVVFWWQRGKLRARHDVLPLLPWLIAGAVAGLFTAWVERKLIGAEGADFDLSWLQRTLLAGHVVWFYFGKLLWPANLTFVYPRWNIVPGHIADWIPLAAALLVVFLFWLIRTRSRAPLAVLLLFAGSLVPVLGFLNVYPFRYSFVADHFQYVASLSVIAGLTALADTMLRSAPRMRLIAAASVAGALGIMTSVQCGIYRDPETLWRSTLARNPGASMAWVHLGSLHAKAGRHEDAIACFRRAAEVNPRDWDAFNNLGCEFMYAGRLAEACAEFARALAINPASPEAHNNMGYALAQLRRYPEAIVHYEQALRSRPKYADAHNNFGVTLTETGQPARAVPQFEAALEITPENPRVHHNFANALRQLNRPGDATAHYERALRLDPALAETREDFGILLLAMGKLSEAVAQFQHALRLKPGLANAHAHLGLALGQLGQVEAALGSFDHALRLAPDHALAALNRGIALAALDRWPEARDAFARAAQLEPGSAEAKRHLGRALANTGATTEARAQFEAALRLQPDSAEIHAELAQLLQALGLQREAAEHRARADSVRPIAR